MYIAGFSYTGTIIFYKRQIKAFKTATTKMEHYYLAMWMRFMVYEGVDWTKMLFST